MKIGILRWDASQIEGSEVEGGFLTVQPSRYGEGGGDGGLSHAPYGFLGRPLDPDEEGACHALLAYEGDHLHAIPTVDLRVLKKLPEPKKGGSMQFGSDGGFGVFDPEEHTHTLYVPVEFDGSGTPTKAHAITVGYDSNGDLFLGIVHADGMGVSMLSGGKNAVTIKNKSGDSFIVLDDDGILINGKKVTIYGPVQVGGVAAQPVMTASGAPSPVLMA